MKKFIKYLAVPFMAVSAMAQTAVTNFPITNVPLSTLTAAGSIGDSDIFYSVVGGNSRKVAASVMKTYFTNGVASVSPSISNEVYFTAMNDGATGSGKRNDPYRINDSATLNSFFPLTNGYAYYFSAGTYTFTNGVVVRGNTILKGEGAGRTIFQFATNAVPVNPKLEMFTSGDVYGYGVSDVVFRDFEIRLNGHLNNSHTNAICGIAFYAEKNVLVENVNVYDVAGNWNSGSEAWGVFVGGPAAGYQTNQYTILGNYIARNVNVFNTNAYGTASKSYADGILLFLPESLYPNASNFVENLADKCSVVGTFTNAISSDSLASNTVFSVFAAITADKINNCFVEKANVGFYIEGQGGICDYKIENSTTKDVYNAFNFRNNATNAGRLFFKNNDLASVSSSSVGTDNLNLYVNTVHIIGNYFRTNQAPWTTRVDHAFDIYNAPAMTNVVIAGNIFDHSISRVTFTTNGGNAITQPSWYAVFNNYGVMGQTITNLVDTSPYVLRTNGSANNLTLSGTNSLGTVQFVARTGEVAFREIVGNTDLIVIPQDDGVFFKTFAPQSEVDATDAAALPRLGQVVKNLAGNATNLAATGLTISGNTTNAPGARIIGSGSNSVESITTISSTNLNLSGTASVNAVTATNRSTFLDGTTNSGPVTFPATDRAWVTFGLTNTGFGFSGGSCAMFQNGTAVFVASASGSQQFGGFANLVNNSGNYYRLSSFGPRWVEEQQQGLMSFTNAFTSGSPVTNRTYGNVEARVSTNGNGGGLISMRTNAFTTTELTADGQWGDWWSNRTAFYRSARNNGNVTNYLITTTP